MRMVIVARDRDNRLVLLRRTYWSFESRALPLSRLDKGQELDRLTGGPWSLPSAIRTWSDDSEGAGIGTSAGHALWPEELLRLSRQTRKSLLSIGGVVTLTDRVLRCILKLFRPWRTADDVIIMYPSAAGLFATLQGPVTH